MRVLANRESLLFASDGMCVPDREDFPSTGVTENVQAVAAAIMEFLSLGWIGPQLANGSVGQHGAQLGVIGLQVKYWQVEKIFGGICEKAKPLPFRLGGNKRFAVRTLIPVIPRKNSAHAFDKHKKIIFVVISHMEGVRGIRVSFYRPVRDIVRSALIAAAALEALSIAYVLKRPSSALRLISQRVPSLKRPPL